MLCPQLFTIIDLLSTVPAMQRKQARVGMSHTANSELSEKHYATMRSLGKPSVCFASSAGSTAAGRASAVTNIPSWRIATRNMRARQACGDFFEDQPVVDVLVRTIAAHTPSAIYDHQMAWVLTTTSAPAMQTSHTG